MIENNIPNKETLQRIIDLAVQSAKPGVIENEFGKSEPFLLLPDGVKPVSVANFCPPTRIKRGVNLLDAGSFADYVNRFKNDNTLIFANITEKTAFFTAFLDYHGKGEPDFCDHLAQFSTLATPEWVIWLAANRKEFGQVEFATWLEDNLQLFTEPKGADFLEIITTLEGKQEVRFTSGVRLQSGGNELNYEEDVGLSGQGVKAGKIKMPQTIKAKLVLFHGGKPVDITARLKYRIASRKITFWLETVNLPKLVRDSLIEVTKEIAEKTKIIPLLGDA